MHFSKSMRATIASICCCGILHPALTFGQVPTTPATNAPAPIAVATPVPPASSAPTLKPVDVELTIDRSMVGQLVNHNGIGIASAPVEIWQKAQLIQTSMTDEEGRYRLASLDGGTYEINFGDRIQPARCWTSGTAPPNSIASLRSIADEEVVRAQQRSGAVCGVVNPWIIAGVAVAAIVIPVALHNHREDRAASN